MQAVYRVRGVKTMKEKLAVKREFFDRIENPSFFGRLTENASERDIQAEFPDLPSCITNPMANQVAKVYNKDRLEVARGERSIRSYKRNGAVYVGYGSLRFQEDDVGHRVVWSLGRKGGKITFAIRYGEDRGGFRKIVQRIIDGEMVNEKGNPLIGTPQFKREKGSGKMKIFLLLPIKEPAKEPELDESLVVGVDIGMSVLAYWGLSRGPARGYYGSEKEQLTFRRQFQSRRRRLLRVAPAARGGHGYSRKTKAANLVRDKEGRKVDNDNHFISRQVVKFALENGAGVIKMEDLSGIHDRIENRFLFRNWCYYDLQSKIEYKAKREGIKVLYVDPAYTSQTCIYCGNVKKSQRDKNRFKCKACGKEEHSDYVGAVNVARRENGKAKRRGKSSAA